MTKENLESAIESGCAFTIRMADGATYEVPHRDFIAWTRKRTAVVVTDAGDHTHILPLLTMTGVSQGSEPISA